MELREVGRAEEMLFYTPKVTKEALLLGIEKFKELYGKAPKKLLISKDFKDVVPKEEGLEVKIVKGFSPGYFAVLPQYEIEENVDSV
jgi:hypothetical protein